MVAKGLAHQDYINTSLAQMTTMIQSKTMFVQWAQCNACAYCLMASCQKWSEETSKSPVPIVYTIGIIDIIEI